MSNWLERTELLIGEAAMQKLLEEVKQRTIRQVAQRETESQVPESSPAAAHEY